MKMTIRLLTTTLAVTALGGVTQAETVSFTANLTADQVISGGANISDSTASGIAEFELNWDPANPSTATLSYEVEFFNADLDGLQTISLDDDITAVHLHDLNVCVSAACQPGDSAGTLHTLNIFGTPRFDDGDITLMPLSGKLSGLWDAGDANTLQPAPSFAPEEYLDELFNGDMFLMVHTRDNPSGAFGGRLVPEPTSMGLLGTLLLGVGMRRRR